MADLSHLTKEQKLLLLDLIAEKKRRQREKLALYKPNTGQIQVHKSVAEERWVFAGNGSGKSALAANEAIWGMKGYNPLTQRFTKVPARGIVVLDHPDKVTDQWLPELAKWTSLKPEQLNKRGKPYVSQVTDTTGSELLFMFHQQDPLIFESIEADFVIFDEPPPRHIYIALKRSLRKKGRKPWILGVGTPIQAAWLRKEIFEPWQNGDRPGTECFRYGTVVNEANLAEGYIASYSQALSEKEKRIRLEGEFFDLEGLALAHLFKRETHVIGAAELNWDSSYPCVVAIDPHPNKKHVAILLGADRDDQLYVLKEYASREAPREFARSLKQWYRGYRLIDIVCDSLGSTPLTGGDGNKSFIEVLKEEGIYVRATTYEDKKEEAWLMRIQDALAVPIDPGKTGPRPPRLRVVDGNRGIISDIESVTWVKYRNADEYKPSLDISNKDYLSCLKYALATNLNSKKGKVKAYYRTGGAETYGIKKQRDRSAERLTLVLKRR